MKVWERVLYNMLIKIVKIDDCQFGFMHGRSTTEAIYIARQLQEKFGEKRPYHVFVDLEKAFDKRPRNAIRWVLRRQNVPEYRKRFVIRVSPVTRTNMAHKINP